GLETRQDDLRRVQLFPFFSFVADAEELRGALKRNPPDVILLVDRYFSMAFVDVLHEVGKAGFEIPIIVILPDGQDLQGIEAMKRGAQDYLLETELQRLPPSIMLALRDKPVKHPGGVNPNETAAMPSASFVPAGSGTESAESLIGSLIDIVTELDLIGNILYESPSIFDQLGYTQEELIGRNAFTLIHPLDVPRVMPVFMVALANPGIPHSARFRFKHKKGGWRILESVGKAIPGKDGGRRMIVTSRVFTDEARVRPDFGDTDAQFMDLVECLGEGILITDTSDKILYANPRMGEFTGHSVQDLLGQLSYKLFLPEEAWPLYMQQKEKWLLGNREEYEISVPKKDGSLLCMHVNVSPYRNREGIITGTLSAFTDMTKRKNGEEEIQRAFEHLKSAKERAEEMNRLKTSFLNNIGHEVRTPLNSILGFSSLMNELLEGTEYATYASSIHASGKRLFDTFESILDLSRVESKTLELNPSRVYLDAEVHRIMAQMLPLAREKRLEMSVDAGASLAACVDVHYFERVLKNMIGNAIKFTPEGFIRIRVRRADDDASEIDIEDSGVGISEEFLPYLFQDFYQESDGLARQFEGTGLGLRISKRLLEHMGGSISVTSTKGKGSCFTIALPLNIPDYIPAEALAMA
ncbi:MAG TPA: PAS domain S-box protein, partial [Candidatus Kapabacteria bacterium]